MLKLPAAFGAVLKIFFRLIAAIGAAFIALDRTVSLIENIKVGGIDLDVFAMAKCFTGFLIKLIDRIAAAGLDEVAVVPFEDRDKEKI